MKRTVLLLTACALLATLACGGPPDDPPAGAPPGKSPATPLESPEPHLVRPSALAGQGWYPADPEALARKVDAFLDAAPEWKGDAPIALVAPHAGYSYAGPQQGRVYRTVRGRSYVRVFILGVPHRALVRGVSIPKATHYDTPLGQIPVDRATCDRLLERGRPFFTHPDAHAKEHSVEIHLPFLKRAIGDFFLVPMLVGVDKEGAKAVAAALATELRPGDLVVASSDNCHYGERYGYLPFPNDEKVRENLKALNMGMVERILALDLDGVAEYKARTGITMCGYSPVCVLLALLPESAKATLTGYANSGDATGRYEGSVSYVGVAFTGPDWGGPPPPPPHGLSPDEQALALRLARKSMELWVREERVYDPADDGIEIPESMKEKRACFVTLTEGGRLRGCIGDIAPRRPLVEAILARAISSAAEDHRFKPVSEEELGKIHVEISVLTPPRPVASYEEIVIGKHGILLGFEGQQRSVYLPQVAPEQGWNLEETLTNLSRKGGLPGNAWRSPRASFMVFTAQVFGEDE